MHLVEGALVTPRRFQHLVSPFSEQSVSGDGKSAGSRGGRFGAASARGGLIDQGMSTVTALLRLSSPLPAMVEAS